MRALSITKPCVTDVCIRCLCARSVRRMMMCKRTTPTCASSSTRVRSPRKGFLSKNRAPCGFGSRNHGEHESAWSQAPWHASWRLPRRGLLSCCRVEDLVATDHHSHLTGSIPNSLHRSAISSASPRESGAPPHRNQPPAPTSSSTPPSSTMIVNPLVSSCSYRSTRT